MKRIILGILALSAMLCGCQKNDVSEQVQDSATLQATIENVASTKTVMDANNNILWSEGDQIIAFMKTSLGLQYQVTSSSVGKASARFEEVGNNGGGLNAGTEWDHNIAYYPYSEIVECLKSGSNYSLSVVLPSEQIYTEESFGNGSMAMVAVSEDNNITFRNILGGMKLQLRGTQKVVSIKLEGKNSEKLSGAATVTAYTDDTKPAITMASGASTSVTLNCGVGVQLNESKVTEFIISLPPVLLGSGFTLTVTDSDNKTYTIETDKTNTVLRSSLLVMPPVKLGGSTGDDSGDDSADYIDEYGVNHGKGTAIGMAVWAPVNCGYHKDDYKYGKLYQWGRKYGQGYDGELYDVNGDRVGEVSDATVPTFAEGGVSEIGANHKSNANVFYTGFSDWVDPRNDELWNSGSESNPVKTDYDPCPDGWRVPTYAELSELSKNHSSWTTDENGQVGYWFSGASTYTETVPQVFFPAASYRCHSDGSADFRGLYGSYWSSRPGSHFAYDLFFGSSSVSMNYGYNRAGGSSVRCVQATDEVAEL